jgi:hypothetical protein
MRENKFIQYYTDLIHLLNLFLCFLLCWIREYLQAELMWVKLHPRHHVDESKTSGREITDDSETARRIPFSEVAVSILYIQSHESLIPQNLIIFLPRNIIVISNNYLTMQTQEYI